MALALQAVSGVPDLAAVKARLNKTTPADDVELQQMLDAALAEYAAHVRPLPGTQTLRLSGGHSPLILPAGATAATVAYANGTTATGLDLDPATGLLHGATVYGARNLTVTVTFGDLPAHHREAILSDVAGLFERTQRGNSPSALPGGYGESLAPDVGRPTVLFPRIRSLAVGVVA